jgi:hypothetical protein
LAILVSRVKTRNYDRGILLDALTTLQERWSARSLPDSVPDGLLPKSERLKKAFLPSELDVITALRREIARLEDEAVRDFFLVALLSVLPQFSRAVADGGWFRWVERPDQSGEIARAVWKRAREMIQDIGLFYGLAEEGPCEVRLLDARFLHQLKPRQFDGLITSPPYANRHDYSRVFHIELLVIGREEEDIRTLRYQSLRSHVEAKPRIGEPDGYEPPPRLLRCLEQLPPDADRRIRRMMEGYFKDLFLVLRSAREVLQPGAKVALVVGNVRHAGVLFPVDEILQSIGQQLGYHSLGCWVVRLRGNSAQQMGRLGRVPSRETIVMLRAD